MGIVLVVVGVLAAFVERDAVTVWVIAVEVHFPVKAVITTSGLLSGGGAVDVRDVAKEVKESNELVKKDVKVDEVDELGPAREEDTEELEDGTNVVLEDLAWIELDDKEFDALGACNLRQRNNRHNVYCPVCLA
ncbi:hypothetical protein SLS60_010465 [Paraconiothyrium brasiliense]|uniref:Uncharacterized protein n=1 Tax=Paraconiothyrium brasiliense TaxID=300254 RepID=A0ABR3QP26_9PLEO